LLDAARGIVYEEVGVGTKWGSEHVAVEKPEQEGCEGALEEVEVGETEVVG
jgi:hypothetical protein